MSPFFLLWIVFIFEYVLKAFGNCLYNLQALFHKRKANRGTISAPKQIMIILSVFFFFVSVWVWYVSVLPNPFPLLLLSTHFPLFFAFRLLLWNMNQSSHITFFLLQILVYIIIFNQRFDNVVKEVLIN